LARYWIRGRRKTTRSRTNICSSSTVSARKRKVVIRAIKKIEPGDEINYDYGTDYFKAYLKPIGCKCDACEKKRKKKRAEARAERLRLRAKEEKKAQKKALKEAEKKAAKARRKKAAKAKSPKAQLSNGKLLNGHSQPKMARKKSAAAKPKTPVKLETVATAVGLDLQAAA
jgi:regulator of protease activity HflC (stomatin/prohibitin superfamily)